MEIHDQAFLVTGASSGLGEACARELVRCGGRVVLADVNDESGNSLAAELGEAARFVHTDVADEASAKTAVQTAVDLWGGLRGAINCAGILGAARVVGREGPHDLELFRRVIDVNLIGTFNVLRLAAAAMAKLEPLADEERGVIVNTASISAFEGQIGQAAYSASKGGIVGMTLPIARELARYGIRVVSIAPGVFQTPLMDALPEAAQHALTAHCPFPPRMGQPAEFAALARHIIENPMLNGSTLRLDGAMRMPAR